MWKMRVTESLDGGERPQCRQFNVTRELAGWGGDLGANGVLELTMSSVLGYK